MPQGMKRTTIMSHGRNHDSLGVRGTHLKGTIPTSTVLNAIPASANTIANIPETASAGTAGVVTREGVSAPVRTSKFIPRMDEGVPVLPGGNRDGGGGSSGIGTSRPQLDDVSVPAMSRSSSGHVAMVTPTEAELAAAPVETPVAVLKRVPAPVAPPPEPTPVVVEDAFVEEPEIENATQTLRVRLPDSKRKLTRAKVDVLREWCVALEIDPEEYVDEDVEVTGDLMRELIAEVQGIDLE